MTTRELTVGTVTLERLAAAAPFYCTRCRVEKTSKLRGTWIMRDGTRAVICNGCYGSLCAAYKESP